MEQDDPGPTLFIYMETKCDSHQLLAVTLLYSNNIHTTYVKLDKDNRSTTHQRDIYT